MNDYLHYPGFMMFWACSNESLKIRQYSSPRETELSQDDHSFQWEIPRISEIMIALKTWREK